MAEPALSNFAQNLYDLFEPLQYAEAGDVDYALAKYLAAVAAPFDLIWDLVIEGEDGVPWQDMLVIESCPPDFLDWLGYCKGVSPAARGTDDDTRRLRLHEASYQRRGTPQAIVLAAQTRLTGSQHVVLEERTPTPWSITVTVYGGEVLNADEYALRRAIESVKPAGIVLYLNALAPERWDDINVATQWDTPAPAMTWDTASGL